MKLFLRNLIVGLFLVTVLILAGNKLKAKEDNENDKLGISINQAVFAFDVNPEEKHIFTLQVKNISEKDQRIKVLVNDYSVQNQNKIIFQKKEAEIYGISKWTKTEQSEFILKPGEEKKVSFTFIPTADIAIGSHHGAVLFQTMLVENKEGVKMSGRLGAHVLINVKGAIHGEGELLSFDTPFFVNKKVSYTAEYKNKGNIHYIPHGEVILRNILTEHKEKYNFNKHFVFPNTSYLFKIEKELPSSFGFYQATAYFVDGESHIHKKSCYLMGYLFLPLVVIIGGLIFGVIKWTRKKEIRKA